MMISCDAPSPLGKYDSYCEGLRADYFLLPKQKNAPSLTGLSPNTSAFVTSLNDTVMILVLIHPPALAKFVSAVLHIFACFALNSFKTS